MIDKDIKDYCKNCDVEPPAMKFKCPECEHNPDKEQIIIDNVSNFCLVCYYDNKNKELVRIEQYKDGSGDIQTDIESHKYGYNAKIIKPEELIKQLARKTQECELLETQLESYHIGEAKLVQRNQELEQECEKLEDFRTLTRGVFTFGDSDVDDENFIKYLQEYSRSYEEAIDGYYRLTDITGIDYTVHGGADIEEIIKRVDVLKQECEQIKEKYEALELEHQEVYEIVAELKYVCEELKREVDEYKEVLEVLKDI